MIEIICATITAVAGIIVATLSVHVKRVDDRNEERARIRQEAELLQLKMSDTVLKLSTLLTSSLMQNGFVTDENVDEAYQAAKAVADEYKSFMQRATAQQIGK